MSYTPSLYLPSRKRKGLVKLFGGVPYPFYYTVVAVVEGQPMKPAAAVALTDHTEVQKMQPAVQGEGAKVFGLAMQITYDDSTAGQLRGYHFANDTRQRLDGGPIGMLGGQGHALLESYQGTIAAGEKLAIGPSGLLVSENADGISSGDLVPVVADTGGSNGSPIRIRFDFPLAVQA